MAGPDALSAPRAIFQETWWLDAACPRGWEAVTETRDSRVVGWLAFERYRRDGVTWCGAPRFTRLAFPLVDVDEGKYETVTRARAAVESELIRRLPSASVHEFILPPYHANALPWQMLGYEARVQHTFRIEAGGDEAGRWAELNSKTRNLVRRAQDVLQPREIDAEAFAAVYRTTLGTLVSPDDLERVTRIAAAAIAHGQGRAVAVVDAAGQPHGAGLFVWDATDYYYLLSTRDPERAVLGAVDHLVWLGIVDAMQRGLRFDFDGVSSPSRLHFLQAFGGRLAARFVVTRRSGFYDARVLLRRLRHRLQHGELPEFP
jgi:hypothetical protein